MKNYFSHRTALVDQDVSIGEGTKVWAFSHISSGAKIGSGCVIGEGVHIGPGVVIGDRVKIQNPSIIYRGVTVGDDVFIGPNVVTTNDIMPRAEGDWSERFRETVICNRASIGANSTLVCGITVGEGSMVGAGSVVTKNVEAGMLVFGNPAEPRRYLDE